jgi:outer membrane protein TolC
LALLVCSSLGCSQTFYRQQADAETYPAIRQRVLTPTFDIGRTQIEPEPQSRLADPFNPDATPKPPDDPAAAAFMAHPYRFRGAKTWGRYGHTDQIEPPGWEQCLGLEPNGTLKLDQTKATEVALANSREYQFQLEQVYLTALALTLNRFEFDTQWFTRHGLTYTGVGLNSGLPTESNTLALSGSTGFSRNLAAGGQLLANFANSFVWEFTGRSHFVTGNLGFQFIQPLLRGFGRDVRLESLTQAERNTLYAVRDFARFRKQFWAGVAVQDNGYLGLLLQVQLVRNARENLAQQQRNYDDIQSQFQGNKKSVVEVDQALQGLLGARQQILDAEIGLQNSLDGFKLTLGLPPRLPVELDDAPLERFVVISPEVQRLRDDLEQFRIARNKELDDKPEAEALKKYFDELAKLVDRTRGAIDQAEADLKSWKPILDRPARPGDDPEAREQAAETYRRQADAPADGRNALKELAASVVIHRDAVTGATRPEGWNALQKDVGKLTEVLDSAIAAQTLARTFRIELPAVETDEATALEFAKANRLDLMNQLAGVTDAWRKVIVAANALQSDLTVTTAAALVAGPAARNPFDFSNDAGRFSVGVQFDGPLNRQAERNAYRAAQIDYQRARRAYMALSDRIEQQVRVSLRSLRQTRVSFELARLRLVSAARQVDNERAQQNAPVPANQRGPARDSTLSTLQALANLNAARNDLAGRYIQYEQQRVQLQLNLEQLQLDARGLPTNASPLRNAAVDDRVRPVPDLDRGGPPAAPPSGTPAQLPPGKP